MTRGALCCVVALRYHRAKGPMRIVLVCTNDPQSSIGFIPVLISLVIDERTMVKIKVLLTRLENCKTVT